jgi:hypothetical protein
MAKKTAAELQLKQEQIEGPKTMEDAGEEYTPGPPPPYPGSYRFRPPSNFASLWDKYETAITDRNKNPLPGKEKVERISIVFDKDDPLIIVQAPPGEEATVGGAFTTRVNNRERDRARKGDPPLYVADLLYLLRAWNPTGAVPKSNQEYIAEAMKHAGKEFGADVEWSANCNEENQIYIEVQDESGNVSTAPGVDQATQQPVKGCGKRYYMNNWVKGADGRYLPRHRCECGASLRPYGSLRNFRA